MDVLKLLGRLERESMRITGECLLCVASPKDDGHELYCELGKAIDALRSGRLVVVDTENDIGNYEKQFFVEGIKIGRPIEMFFGTPNEYYEWMEREWNKKEQGE